MYLKQDLSITRLTLTITTMITYDEEEIEQALYKGAKVAYLYLALKV
jgi:hypothetical protein